MNDRLCQGCFSHEEGVAPSHPQTIALVLAVPALSRLVPPCFAQFCHHICFKFQDVNVCSMMVGNRVLV